MEIIEEQKLINLPVYSTNPKIRMNRNIYDNLNLELDGFVEPSTVVCIAKLKEKK